MSAIVGINHRHGLKIVMYCTNQPNMSKYNLEQLHISNKTLHFSYKCGCGVTRDEAFKRTAGLGNKYIASGYH